MIIFFILAALALFGALNMVLRANPAHSAMSLVFTLIATAGLFLTLGAEFLAVVQVIVYAGAIMVLFIFVIMLLNTRSGEGGEAHLHRVGFGQAIGVALAAFLVLLLSALALRGQSGAIQPATSAADMQVQAGGNSQALGLLLYGKYLFPFEVASVLLLVAIIGAVAMSRRHLGFGSDRDDRPEDV